MVYTPNKALSSILRPAFKPCAGFDGACKDVAQWKPERGHVPRGFVGALGSTDEVEVVLLIAEPGNPYTVGEILSESEYIQPGISTHLSAT